MLLNPAIPIIVSLDEMMDLGRQIYPDPQPNTRSVEDEIEVGELRLAVQGFVSTLPVEDRELVKSVYWKSQSQASFARRIGYSRAAVNKRLRKICNTGKEVLSEYRSII